MKKGCAIARCCRSPMIGGCAPPNWSPSTSPISGPPAIPTQGCFIFPAKGDQEGEGATTFLSMRSVLALQAWIRVMADLLDVPTITQGPIFRRLFIKPLKPQDAAAERAARRQQAAAEQWSLASLMPKVGKPRRTGIDPLTAVTLGSAALRPQAVTQIYKVRVQGAWDAGLLPDLTKEELAQWANFSLESNRPAAPYSAAKLRL